MYDLNAFASLVVQWAIEYSGVLFGLFVALNVADVLLTVDILMLGGYEINPVARWFIEFCPRAPALGLIVLKTLSIVGVCYFLAMFDDVQDALSLLGLCAFYVWVVGHNFQVLATLDGEL